MSVAPAPSDSTEPPEVLPVAPSDSTGPHPADEPDPGQWPHQHRPAAIRKSSTLSNLDDAAPSCASATEDGAEDALLSRSLCFRGGTVEDAFGGGPGGSPGGGGSFALRARYRVFRFVETPGFDNFVSFLIVLNCAVMVADNPRLPEAPWAYYANLALLVMFTLEMFLKIFCR